MIPKAVLPDSVSGNPRTLEELTAANVRAVFEMERAAKRSRSRGEHWAAEITRVCGSLTFVWAHILWFAGWVAINVLLAHPFDPYPFNFLTMVVSLEAIFLSMFIMIAENRQERIAERRSNLDLQINLLSEQENTKMLHLLREIALKVGVPMIADDNLSMLEETTSPQKLVEQIQRGETEES